LSLTLGAAIPNPLEPTPTDTLLSTVKRGKCILTRINRYDGSKLIK